VVVVKGRRVWEDGESKVEKEVIGENEVIEDKEEIEEREGIEDSGENEN
jgi:hypothetical protein